MIFNNTPCTASHLRARTRMQGLTLVEILVSAVLGALMLVALMGFVGAANKNFTATSHSAQIQETGRVAMEILSEELHRAGFWAGTMFEHDISEVVGGTLTVTPAGSACATLRHNFGYLKVIDQHLHGLNGSNTNGTNHDYQCLTPPQGPGSYIQGNDLFTVRYALPAPSIAGNLKPDAPYLRLSAFAGRLFLGQDFSDSANQIAGARSQIFPLTAQTYFVGDSGRECQGEPIPSLFRITVSSDQPAHYIQELLPGITQLQIQYLESTDGLSFVYRNAGTNVDWSAVVAAKIWVVARAQCPERGIAKLRTGQANSTLDIGDISYTPNPKFRHAVFQQVVSLRNIK